MLQEKCYIGGHWVDGKEKFSVANPSTGKVIGHVPKMGRKETHQAIQAAYQAYLPWRAMTAKERSLLLKKWHALILEHLEALAKILTLEQGKPLNEAKGEILYGASFVEWFAEEGKRAYGDIIPSPNAHQRLFVMKQPIGVVGAITPWNFPNAMITRKCAPALAAGCTVVLKPAEATPFSALALAKLAEQAGIPAGVLNVITGDPAEIGQEMTQNRLVRKIAFTGSTRVGKLLLSQSASSVKKVTLELGGSAPFIVFADADIKAALPGLIASKFRNSGQTCICADRIFVEDSIYDSFADALAKEVKKLKVGDGFETDVQIGPLINKAGLEKVESQIADALSHGAKTICGGKRHPLGGNFFEPTVLSHVTPKMRVCYEETFGPVIPLIRFKSEEEVVHMANDTEYGLASYLYSSDLNRIWRVAEALENGMVSVNGGLFSSEVFPFGGVKESGIGREGSKYGLDDYLEIKSIILNTVQK
ncbi:MAG: NAD-dependent succinate-semialdehyde dehydrogenase [Verrucomicrobia bacterium]|nr:NAD-dependent succinate-semialdehyde dehydrogenase [Verrucomicrobiota bacterium]MBU6446659.1 NAD-dependent succinate-semialdehyde dehydrogenase [Verrucomicrobiota bacterium]MDE3048012.1 NAD-dependent succinate-semialdehyde dehydrogenase [Verrucomicrobiota bacterium]